MTDATHTSTTFELDKQKISVLERKPEDGEKEKQAAQARFLEHQAQLKKDAAEKRDKLLAVAIDRSEAATLALEFGISKEIAENTLREHGGAFEAAVDALLAKRPTKSY
jgi:predicted 3-demethylubiquinone-9 3-methyltransferase (glyoxalase superfamily)